MVVFSSGAEHNALIGSVDSVVDELCSMLLFFLFYSKQKIKTDPNENFMKLTSYIGNSTILISIIYPFLYTLVHNTVRNTRKHIALCFTHMSILKSADKA